MQTEMIVSIAAGSVALRARLWEIAVAYALAPIRVRRIEQRQEVRHAELTEHIKADEVRHAELLMEIRTMNRDTGKRLDDLFRMLAERR